MTDMDWWKFYSTEAAHRADFAMNPFFSAEDRVTAQRDAARLYEAARKVRESMDAK